MSETAASATRAKKSGLSNLLGGGKSYWVVALIAALIAAGVTLQVLGRAAATTTYYVLGQDIPARTQITSSLLVPVQTSLGGEPRNEIDPVYLNQHQGDVFSLYALKAGDVLSPSTVGPLARINKDLPDNFVAASFQLTPENAVAGKVRRGDYIDIIAVNDANADAGATAKVVLHHVLVLDVTVAPQTIAQAANAGQAGANANNPGPESAQVRGGIPSLYTVGLSPQDAVTLALVRDKNLMIALSANDATGSLTAQAQLGGVFGPDPAGDAGAGTLNAAPTDGSTAKSSGSAAPASGSPSAGASAGATASGSAADPTK